MTTEQTARSAGSAELNGRAGFYLAAVSSGLIALAFAGQASRLGTAFYVFGLVLLPTLAFVGVTTFERAAQPGRRCPARRPGDRHPGPRQVGAHRADGMARPGPDRSAARRLSAPSTRAASTVCARWPRSDFRSAAVRWC